MRTRLQFGFCVCLLAIGLSPAQVAVAQRGRVGGALRGGKRELVGRAGAARTDLQLDLIAS